MKKPHHKYLKVRKDDNGRRRYYLNRTGFPQTRLPGSPGEPEFEAAYLATFKASEERLARKPVERAATAPGTFSDLVERYYKSANFIALRSTTKLTYRGVIERLRAEHGSKAVADLDRRGVKLMLAKKAQLPGAANLLLRMLRMLMGFAIEEQFRTDDPTAKIKRLKVPGDGFVAWEEQDIAAFEERHPIGTKPRLALALLLYTAQRRGDVIRLGRGHIRRGRIVLTQNKTGVMLEVPIHDELAELLRSAPVGPTTFLCTRKGKPYTPEGFGNWFRKQCELAGLPTGYNAHGLRKAACRRLAEAGCSPHEIMSISGHKTLAEVERYTKAAKQPALAAEAMRKFAATRAA